MDFIPYFKPNLSQDEINEVVCSVKSGWLTTGPKTALFEQHFMDFLGVDTYCHAVNSATSGLHLALLSLGIGEGDEVITSTHTFTATAAVIKHVRATPVLCDIREDDFCIDPEDIERKITQKTKAIIVVHFAGQSCRMDEIFKISRKYGLRVIEDAAHALPTTYKNNIIGTLNSDVTVFSFYANKTITTGEGGMVVTRNPELSNQIKMWRTHGINRDAFDRYRSELPSWHYDILAPGYKYNLTDIAASIGIHQLAKAKDNQVARVKIADFYGCNISDCVAKKPELVRKSDIHAWHIYNIRLNDSLGIDRNAVIEYLYRSGIGVSVHYIPLHKHTYWKKTLELNDKEFTISNNVFKSCISLPIFPGLKENELEHIVDTINKLAKI